MNGLADQTESMRVRRGQTDREPVFRMVPELICRPDIGEYRTYAIRFQYFGTVRILHDVSADPTVVKQIVELANLHDASPEHLVDIVMDMLP